MKFLPNTDKGEIVSALLSGQSKIEIGSVEIVLKALKRDTLKNKEREASKVADSILKLL